MATDLIVYAIIAAALVFWLRSILGTKNGEERDRANPFTGQDDAAKINPGPVKDGGKVIDVTFPAAKSDDRAVRVIKTTLASRVKVEDSAREGLRMIAEADRSFTLERFLEGAEAAFEMIVVAFARGDTATLRGLLAPNVFNDFESAVTARATRGETVETKVEAVRGMDVISARLAAGVAYIAVRFTAQETCLIRNAAGTVISGDPEKTTTMVDVWTFGRDVATNSPIWYLHETRDEQHEDHKTPLPESV